MATVNLVDSVKGATTSEYGGIREAFLKATGLTAIEGQDVASFILNPPSDSIYLCVRKIGSSIQAMRLRPDSRGVIDLDCLENENYEIEAYSMSTDPPLLLHKFQMKKSDDGVDVHAVDLKATALDTRFSKSDTPLGGAVVLGKFTDRNGYSCNLNGKTDNQGNITLVLPEGVIENLIAKKSEIVVEKQGTITLPPPSATPTNIPRKPKCIMIDSDTSSFSATVKPDEPDARVVVLGDISGSMSCGTQMDILRRSFEEIFDKCQKNKWKISLASWDTSVEWCTETWIQPNENEHVKLWIKNQHARGNNDMRNPIDDCMRRYPDVTDVYIMCDGDVTPFNAYQGELNWGQHRAKYEQAKFHFIALGRTASHESMEAMAFTGGGTFTEST
ncbi:unnamed protein product [Rotaria magnacalcarata]|uniref:VWFA domain-containing protein n=1 Tax=Rotaria magnacalcarata TaxID=392030 RepID=A0A816R9F7_9BILA|nr:unnamed protein product [Rotaria magnacalcarata]CAF4277582.1 unnamed protein product [Rotaria magnacalcarata]